MPNVRASSGMIGTTRGPSCLSRARVRSSRVKPIVVLTSCWLDPARSSANALSSGSVSGRRARVVRRGGGPPPGGGGGGEPPADPPPALHHVLELDGVLRRLVVRRIVGLDRVLGQLLVQVQPVA